MSDHFLPFLHYMCLVCHAVKLSKLLSLYRSQDLPLLLHIPKFQKPDALPCSCSELPIRYWYAHARAYQRGFDVCLKNCQSAIYPHVVTSRLIYRHIIAPLCIVPVYSFSGCSDNPSAKTQIWLYDHHPRRSSFLPIHVSNAPLSSFTIPSNASLISALTSSSQFSFIDSAQLVCCRKRCSSPHLMPDICGSEEVI